MLVVEGSELLTQLMRRYNEIVEEYDHEDAPRPNVYDLLIDVFDQAEYLLPEFSTWSARNSGRRIKWRRLAARKVNRGLAKRYMEAFCAFEASLAACEFINRSMVRAYRDWMDRQPPGERVPSFFGFEGTVGGRHVKILLLLAMHARSVRIGSEILILLREGHQEGAAARSRTLYELTVKMFLICQETDDNGWELAERYFASSQLEAYSKQELFSDSLDEQEISLRDLAMARWGAKLFSGQHNWAEPAVTTNGRGNVTFRQMEEAVEASNIRHMYLECNHAVHVGALKLIESTDFRRSYLHSCRSEVDVRSTGRLGQAAAFYLKISSLEMAKRITSDLEEWDWMLSTIEFYRKIEEAIEGFYKVYSAR